MIVGARGPIACRTNKKRNIKKRNIKKRQRGTRLAYASGSRNCYPPRNHLNNRILDSHSETSSNFLNHLIFVRKLSALQLRVDQLAVHRKLEAAPFRWLQFHTGEFLFELSQHLGRQTDGLWFVSSSSAVTKLNFHITHTPFTRFPRDHQISVLFLTSSLRLAFLLGTSRLQAAWFS